MDRADFPRVPEEWKSWQYWIDRARVNENLSQLDRKATAAGLEHLRQLFGDEWFRTAAEEGHPLFLTLLNAAPVAQTGVAALGHELVQLQQSTSVDPLIARMKKNREEFHGAIPEITLASKARRAGFAVEFPTTKSGPVEDLRIVDPPVHIEVTALRSADAQQATMRTSFAIRDAILQGVEDVVGGGRISRVLTEDELEEYQRKIIERIREVKNTGRPAALHDDNLDLRFAASTDADAVAAMQAAGYTGLAGPSLFANELYRMCRVLEEKAKGFPDVSDGSGIVVLWDGWAPMEVSDEDVARRFGEILDRYPRVAVAALIYASMTVGRGKHGHAPVVDRRPYGVIIHDVGMPPEEVLLVQRRPSLLGEADLIRLFTGARANDRTG